MPSYFISATGTAIGKTLVTTSLLYQMRQRGKSVSAAKPIISGFSMGVSDGSDSGKILRSMGVDFNIEALDRVSPFRFCAPLAPDMAAEMENIELQLPDLVTASMPKEPVDFHFVEGVGGVAVPFNQSQTSLDWMEALQFSVILVAGNYLGSLSHTISAYEVLRSRAIDVACVVVAEQAQAYHEGKKVQLNDTVASLRRFISSPVHAIPFQRLPEAEPWVSMTDITHIVEG